MRIDKLVSNMGFGSRKEVKQLLKKGAVRVNGETVKDAAFHIDAEKDEVTILGERVVYREFIYLMMNKPQGVLSATEDSRDETVIDLLDTENRHFEPFPVGRLDKDTEGFLLLTNDGKLTHQLLSPKKGVPKVYYAHINGVVTDQDVEKFAEGVTLEDGYLTKPGKLTVLKSAEISEIELTITEGKFHQVKRMFEAVDKKVIYLKRLSMGPLTLDENLQLGSYRELTKEELELLLHVSNN
ncbi:pseudouridine synthase [Filibacter tadaridae]|uniref:Pseudouridine synthase n=1 Tax=Filibacter tadaridae TaxID=2483811 RepID=A0A3P5XE83_9BACL|nr:pseudouridine synthase [Filibacter tadaridae]VDC26868.1 Ribosomal small subunit pseudouridine synthase A [Filibacter tadaridae]